MKILLASPIQQKPEILELFLYSIQNVRRPKGCDIHYFFIDDNEDELSSALLEKFQQSNPHTRLKKHQHHVRYVVDEKTHYWTEELMDRVAVMKDEMIAYAIEQQYDYLWFIDSDLLLQPGTLIHLIEANKDIISCIFWTKWDEASIPLPQVWMSDQYSMVDARSPARFDRKKSAEEANQFLAKLRHPGVYEVGGLGACTLISRNALELGVNFRTIENITLNGEDRHFCVRALALGLKLHVDTRLPAYHIYRPADMAGGYEFIEKHYNTRLTPARVSLCMIVKNDENVIERCLHSVREFVDEIIVVDTGSTDRTKEIAKQHGAKIYDFEWEDDFSAARNFSFEQATMDYIFWMDADDEVEEEERLKLIELKKTLRPDVDSVMMNYHLAFQRDGKPLHSLKRNRLVRRACGFRWEGAVHEFLEVKGKIEQSDIGICHRKVKSNESRNLHIYKKMLLKGVEFTPRDTYYYANELKDHQLYSEAIEHYEKFLSFGQGWVEDQVMACMKLSDCYGVLNEREKQLHSLYRIFHYMTPRPEALVRIGAVFMEEKKYRQAIFWYEAATRCGEPPNSGEFVDVSAWTWLPYLQLSVCYDKIGDLEKAHANNEAAARYNPDHPSVIYNRTYFQKRFEEKIND